MQKVLLDLLIIYFSLCIFVKFLVSFLKAQVTFHKSQNLLNFSSFCKPQHKSGFLQNLHQSSGSWDITPRYFSAKILQLYCKCSVRQEPIKVLQIVEILCKLPKVWNFPLWWAPFVQISRQFQLKKVQTSYLDTLNSDPKFF